MRVGGLVMCTRLMNSSPKRFTLELYYVVAVKWGDQDFSRTRLEIW